MKTKIGNNLNDSKANWPYIKGQGKGKEDYSRKEPVTMLNLNKPTREARRKKQKRALSK